MAACFEDWEHPATPTIATNRASDVLSPTRLTF
jgi:hypothetical protein